MTARPAEKPCAGEQAVQKITPSQLLEAVQRFEEGDPLFISLLLIFAGAEKETCYYVEGEDVQGLFLTKDMLDLSDREMREGRLYYKTRAPVNEFHWLSARIHEGEIKVSLRLHRRFVRRVLGKRVLEIPRVLDFTIRAARLSDSASPDGNGPPQGYRISFVYKNLEEPFVSDLVALLTGISSHEMRARKEDRRPNRREAYKTLRTLQGKGLIAVD